MRLCKLTKKSPENLEGIKKKSFSLPFNNGEIWFEHLDGIYQYTEETLKKLEMDSKSFLSASNPSFIAVVFFETELNQEIVKALVETLFKRKYGFRKICFLGVDWKWKRKISAQMKQKSFDSFKFLKDTEKAKEWLIP